MVPLKLASSFLPGRNVTVHGFRLGRSDRTMNVQPRARQRRFGIAAVVVKTGTVATRAPAETVISVPGRSCDRAGRSRRACRDDGCAGDAGRAVPGCGAGTAD